MTVPWYQREFTGRRLLWNISFYLGHIAIFVYGWLKQSHDQRLAGLNTLKYSVWISRGAGLCLGVDGLLLILPVLRNLIRFVRPVVKPLVPLDENIWFHRQIAYSLLFWTIVHTTAHYVNMFNVELTQIRKETAWGIMYTQPGGFTGHVMLLLMFLMYTTAHHKIRAQSFEAFWYTHHLSFLFLLGFYTHATGCFVRGALPDQPVKCIGYNSWQWTIWAGVAYFVERLVRIIRSRCSTTLVGVLIHPSGAIELRFVKPSLKYKPGQWLFLNVPDVSAHQWHPFTISSAPDDKYISVHIRQVGDWTRALAERLGCGRPIEPYKGRGSTDKGEWEYGANDFVDVGEALLTAGRLPQIRVDGPFGAPAEDVFKSEVAVLIGTGIGVTPFASILKNIWYMQQKRQLGALRRVHFIWCNRDTGAFEWFQTLLRRLEDAQTDPDFLRISMFLTQKIDEDMINNIAINEAGNDLDPLTNLRSRTHFGRPDFTAIFGALRDQIELGHYLPGRESAFTTRVTVYYCGPSELAKSLKEKTKAASSATVRFSFVKEHF